jgi:hypothetical protein
MWWTEVQPSRSGAARLTGGFDGDDLLSITVGATWFELFGVRGSADLDKFRDNVVAVFAGEIQETGHPNAAFAKSIRATA